MRLKTDEVIVVNEKDEWMGTMNKTEAHKEGVLHRALSIFILNDKNELLIQQRALNKYHSGGLWSNSCCSHPAPDESTMSAAHRRLKEEMGFDCSLEKLFTFRYKSDVNNELIENEFDHVYFGQYDGEIIPNPEEVGDHKFLSIEELQLQMAGEPQLFTSWFHLVLPKFAEHIAALA